REPTIALSRSEGSSVALELRAASTSLYDPRPTPNAEVFVGGVVGVGSRENFDFVDSRDVDVDRLHVALVDVSRIVNEIAVELHFETGSRRILEVVEPRIGDEVME